MSIHTETPSKLSKHEYNRLLKIELNDHTAIEMANYCVSCYPEYSSWYEMFEYGLWDDAKQHFGLKGMAKNKKEREFYKATNKSFNYITINLIL